MDIHIHMNHNSSHNGHHFYNYIQLDKLNIYIFENIQKSLKSIFFIHLHRVQSSCHGAQIQVKPSFVSRQIVPSRHGFFEQSSYPKYTKKEFIHYKIFVDSQPRIDSRSPPLHISVEHIHQ